MNGAEETGAVADPIFAPVAEHDPALRQLTQLRRGLIWAWMGVLLILLDVSVFITGPLGGAPVGTDLLPDLLGGVLLLVALVELRPLLRPRTPRTWRWVAPLLWTFVLLEGLLPGVIDLMPWRAIELLFAIYVNGALLALLAALLLFKLLQRLADVTRYPLDVATIRVSYYLLLIVVAVQALRAVLDWAPPALDRLTDDLVWVQILGGLAFVLYTARALYHFHAGLRRYVQAPESGRCPYCNYDLRGNTTGRCSECGQPIPPLLADRLNRETRPPPPRRRTNVHPHAANHRRAAPIPDQRDLARAAAVARIARRNGAA